MATASVILSSDQKIKQLVLDIDNEEYLALVSALSSSGSKRQLALLLAIEDAEIFKYDNEWIDEISKHYPNVNLLSFQSPKRLVEWLIKEIKNELS